ncbi:hypothetical protein TGVAND_290620 [Toxoplasma gondii VAND]|uniref:Uncharacterized protein n=1 Tax=Toxoplasma gondii VAND TaxID=933077 RepID=A0A086Q953_TOXGO|nr:hypothetical protein TGVAND_290620 [Toxoplasma gondii VAND]
MESSVAVEGAGGPSTYFKGSSAALSRLVSTETTASDFCRSQLPTSRPPTDPPVSPTAEATDAFSRVSTSSRPLITGRRVSTMRAASLSRSTALSASLRPRPPYDERSSSFHSECQAGEEGGPGASRRMHRSLAGSAESRAEREGSSFRLDTEKPFSRDGNIPSYAPSMSDSLKGGASGLSSPLLQRSRSDRRTGLRGESRTYDSEVASAESRFFSSSRYDPERTDRARDADLFERGSQMDSIPLSNRRPGTDPVSSEHLRESRRTVTAAVSDFLEDSRRGVYKDDQMWGFEQASFAEDKPCLAASASVRQEKLDPYLSRSSQGSSQGSGEPVSRNLRVSGEKQSSSTRAMASRHETSVLTSNSDRREERVAYLSCADEEDLASRRESEGNVQVSRESRHAVPSSERLEPIERIHRKGGAALRESPGSRFDPKDITGRFLDSSSSEVSASARTQALGTDPHSRPRGLGSEMSSSRVAFYDSGREAGGLSSQRADGRRTGEESREGEDGRTGRKEDAVETRWGSSLGLSGESSGNTSLRRKQAEGVNETRNQATEPNGEASLFSPFGSGRMQSSEVPRRGEKQRHFSSLEISSARQEREPMAHTSVLASRPSFLPPSFSLGASETSTERVLGGSTRPPCLEEGKPLRSELLAAELGEGGTERSTSLLHSAASPSSVSRRPRLLTAVDSPPRERGDHVAPRETKTRLGDESGETRHALNRPAGLHGSTGFGVEASADLRGESGGRSSDGSRIRSSSSSAVSHLSQVSLPPLPRGRAGDEALSREEESGGRSGRQKRDREATLLHASSIFRSTVPLRPSVRSFSQPAASAGSDVVSPRSRHARDFDSLSRVAKTPQTEVGGESFRLYGKNPSSAPSALGAKETFLNSRGDDTEETNGDKDAKRGATVPAVNGGELGALPRVPAAGAEGLRGLSSRMSREVSSAYQPPQPPSAEECGASLQVSLDREQLGGNSGRSTRSNSLVSRIETGLSMPRSASGTTHASLLASNAGNAKSDTLGKGPTECVCQASRYMTRQKVHYEQQMKRVEEEREQQRQRRRILAEQEAQVALLQSQVQRQREGVVEEEKQLREMRAQLTAEREAMETRWQQLEKQHQELAEKKEKWRKTAQQKRDELQAFSHRIRADKKELDEKKKEVARDTTSLKDKVESVEKEQDRLNRERVELEEVRFALDREKAELDARISATEDERHRLKKKEEELIRRETKAQSKEDELRREQLEVEKRTQAVSLKAEEEEQKELDRVSLWRQKNEELDRRARLVHEQETDLDARTHALRMQETERKREDEREKKKLQQMQETFLEDKKSFAREKGRVEAQLDEEKKRLVEEKKTLEEARGKWEEERRREHAEFERKKKVWEEERSARVAELAAKEEAVREKEKLLEEEENRRREEMKKLTQELRDEKEQIARQLDADREDMRARLGAEREKLHEERLRGEEELQKERERLETQMEHLKEKERELEGAQNRWKEEQATVESRLREAEEKVLRDREVLAQEREAFEEEVRREREQFHEEQEAVLAEFRAQRQMAERELAEQKEQQEEMLEEERQRLLQAEERQQETYAEQMNQLRNLEEQLHQQKLHHQQDVSRHLEREEALFERERRLREEDQSVQDEKQKLSKEKQAVGQQWRQLEETQSQQKQEEASLKKEREALEDKTRDLRDQVQRVAEVDEKLARLREAEDALEIERAALEAEKESFRREKELIDAQVGAWRRKLSQREQEVGRRERAASTRLRDIETQEKVHRVRMEEDGSVVNRGMKQTASGALTIRRGPSLASGRAPSVSRQPLARERGGDTVTREEAAKEREEKKPGTNARTRCLSTERRREQKGNVSAGGPKVSAGRRTVTPAEDHGRGRSATKRGQDAGGREGEEGETKSANGDGGRNRKRPGAAVRESSSGDQHTTGGKNGKEFGKRNGVDRVSGLLPALRGQKSVAAVSSTRASSVACDGDEHETETERSIQATTKSPTQALLSSPDRSDLPPQKSAPFSLSGSPQVSLATKGLTEHTRGASDRAEEGEEEAERKDRNRGRLLHSSRTTAEAKPSSQLHRTPFLDEEESVSSVSAGRTRAGESVPEATERGRRKEQREQGDSERKTESGSSRGVVEGSGSARVWENRERRSGLESEERQEGRRRETGEDEVVFQNIFEPGNSSTFARETFPRISHLAASRQSCSSSGLSHPLPASSASRQSPEKAGRASSSTYSPYTFRYSSFLKQQASSLTEEGDREGEEAKRRNPSNEPEMSGSPCLSFAEKSSASEGRPFSSRCPELLPTSASPERQAEDDGKQATRVSPSFSSQSSLCVSPVSLNGLSLGTLDRSRVARSQETLEEGENEVSATRDVGARNGGQAEKRSTVSLSRQGPSAPSSSSFCSSYSLPQAASRISASVLRREERSMLSVERNGEDETERRRHEEHREVSVVGGGSSSLSSQTRVNEIVYRREGTGAHAKRGRGDSECVLSGKRDGFSGRETLSRTPLTSPSGVVGQERSVLSRAGCKEQEKEGRTSQASPHQLQSPRSRQAWKDRLAAACAPRTSVPLEEAEDDTEVGSPFLNSLRSQRNTRKEGESSFFSSSVYRRREEDERRSKGTLIRKNGEAGSAGSFNARESVISHLSAFNSAEDNSDCGSGENSSLSGLGSSTRISTGRGKSSLSGR